MDNECIYSSDESEDFINQFFEDLGSKPNNGSKSPTKKNKNTNKNKNNDEIATDIDSNSEDDPISDSEDVSDGNLTPGRERMGRNEDDQKGFDVGDSPIKIPSIFLTEGEKNKRILRHDKEISMHLEEEQEKNRIRKETLENTKQSLLSELNDNGSCFVYSWKHDSKIVEGYVQRTLVKDIFMKSQRQFYFFNNVQEPVIDEQYRCKNPLLSIALKHLFTDVDQFLKSLRMCRIYLSSFLVETLITVKDLNTLKMAEKIMKRAYELLQKKKEMESMQTLFDLQSTDENRSFDHKKKVPTFIKLMQIVGARSFETSQVMSVPLKLAHFNTYTNLLIVRLSMIFHYYLPCARSKNELYTMLQYFILSCSDFHLNKVDKETFVKTFVGPVFQVFYHEWTQNYGFESFIQECHLVFSSVSPSLYGQQEVQVPKAIEIHFNILMSLLNSVPPNTDAAMAVRLLVYKFFGVKDSTNDILVVLTKVVENIGNLGFSPNFASMPKYKHNVYKNFFKAQILALYLNVYVLLEEHHKSENLMTYYEKLLDCKDAYQVVIGQISYASVENVPDKNRLTLCLSDTYHTLDYMVSVLSKSAVLPDRDFFYDKEVITEHTTPPMNDKLST